MLQDYLPLQPLGNGATGIVFLAQPIKTQKDPVSPLFAIKAFRRSRTHDVHRSHKEEQILSKLLQSNKHSPFLPRLHSAFEDGEFRFLVIDYCSGGDLNVLRASLPDNRFSTEAIRFYAAEIVLALEHLHEQGIVYRDLKPENILLSSDGHIMLTDFDLSVTLPPKKPCPPATLHMQHERQEVKREDEEDNGRASVSCLGGCSGGDKNQRRKMGRVPSRRRVVPASHSSGDNEQAASRSSSSSSAEARSHSFVGTEEYVAPEVIRGTGHDFAVDWWGLGVLLYEMAHACSPFSGRTTKQTFDNVLHQEPKILAGAADSLANLISQLLVKDPAQRIGSRCGAAEVKAHPFFAGLCWDALQGVARPPFIPPSEPSTLAPASRFDLTSHLLEVELSRAEARARRKLQRKKVA